MAIDLGPKLSWQPEPSDQEKTKVHQALPAYMQEVANTADAIRRDAIERGLSKEEIDAIKPFLSALGQACSRGAQIEVDQEIAA